MRTLLRSWFFRIFAGLSVLGIGIFNIAANVPDSGAPFIYRALPASLPYVNLLVLNLGQAIVAVFLASEFLKQDRKNDTIEVIYARSMTNAEYIIGKTLGILLVFFILNIMILSLGIGFSFLSGDASQGILEYFYYPILISVPTLVYILGLSFFIMTLTRNQAITFILLFGYIAVSIFYLDKKYYQVFDFIAYQVPMMKSTIGGFADFSETLIHRGIYFFIGLGLIFFTIIKLDRLPQSRSFRYLPAIISLVFILAGVGSAYLYISNKRDIVSDKKEMIALNNKYLSYPGVHVDSCNINLKHKNKTIEVSSQLFATNLTNNQIDTLIFSLNPALNINEIKIGSNNIIPIREKQIVKIVANPQLNPGQKATISISYSGVINENSCFLDENLEDFKDNFSFEIFRFKKRYAYLNKDFVLLTRDALWYPVSGVGYASDNPVRYSPDFTKYSLTVNTDPSLTAISQGEMTSTEPGTFVFNTELPLPQISLLIGNYINYSIDVDSITYSIYTIDGNDYYKEYFTDIQDSLPGIIRDLKNEYESPLGFNYPFRRFSLAEVPIQFDLDKHLWSLTSDAVQPEITFYVEKGVILEETDFKKRKKRTERRMNRNREEVTPTELQSRIFKRFVRGNFMANYTEWYMFDKMDRNTLTFFPNYITFVTSLKSEKWPALNLSMQAYLKDRHSNPISSYRWFFRNLSKSEKINLELKQSPLSTFKKPTSDSGDPDEAITLYDIILAKGDYLFSVFRARYGEEEFNSFLDAFINNNRGHSFTLEKFDLAMKDEFGESVIDEINSWYYENDLAGFMIKDLQTYKVREGQYTKYQVRFKIANPEDTDGMVTCNIDLFDAGQNNSSNNNEPPDFTKKIYIPAGTAKEVGFVFSTEPVRMNLYTHISLNLPNNIIYDFSSFNETRKTVIFDDIVDCELFDDLIVDGEIIIDNEDSSFSFTENHNLSYLKTWIDENKDPGYPYSGIRFWNPPSDWQQVLRSGFYGKYVRSAMYTRSGFEDQVASWKAPLTSEGYYDIYFHVEKINITRQWQRETRKADYNFKVYHEGGVEDVHLADSDVENGWNYLGTYFVTPYTAKVELTNKSVGTMVFADAVKWVEN